MSARKRGRKRAGSRGFFYILRKGCLLVLTILALYYGLCGALLLYYNTAAPPMTGVQLQRWTQSFLEGQPYQRRYQPVPAEAISPHLRHAVVAAEDGRFYQHGGVDWRAIEKAIEDNRRRGRRWRGGSTITQQLVKNLFMTTHSSYMRKALELPLTYMAELLLSKERILTLYLNVIEWGPGVYGAEAAARHHYDTSARQLSRGRSAALAACIPNPRARTPGDMGWYTDIILRRMRQMGW